MTGWGNESKITELKRHAHQIRVLQGKLDAAVARGDALAEKLAKVEHERDGHANALGAAAALCQTFAASDQELRNLIRNGSQNLADITAQRDALQAQLDAVRAWLDSELAAGTVRMTVGAQRTLRLILAAAAGVAEPAVKPCPSCGDVPQPGESHSDVVCTFSAEPTKPETCEHGATECSCGTIQEN